MEQTFVNGKVFVGTSETDFVSAFKVKMAASAGLVRLNRLTIPKRLICISKRFCLD